MESLTVELCIAEDDPLDRTLSLLMRNEGGLVHHRAWRLRDGVHHDGLIFAVDRIFHRWLHPSLDDADGYGPLLDELEETIAQPF